MASHGVVLLCAEDDDLELVSWVHNARKHGITPEVVTGVEHDDEPLIAALSDPDSRLFVVLRSENLDLRRMHELKSVFARHRQHGQELLALRLQPEEAEDAIVKIAAKIGRDVRPRTGPYPVVPPSERSGTLGLAERSGTLALSDRSFVTPRPVLDDSTPITAGTEPTGVFAISASEPAAEPVAIAAPQVAEALDWARRATELEVTEPLPRIEPTTMPSATRDDESTHHAARRTAVVTLATATAVLMLCAVVGGVLWLAAAEWTSPVDGAQRSSVVAPSDATQRDADAAPSEARIPSMPRNEDADTATKRRSRSRARSDDAELAPLETIVAPARDAASPVLKPTSPVPTIAPAPAEPAAAEPPATAQASASAPAEPGTTATPAADSSGTAVAGATTRPPA